MIRKISEDFNSKRKTVIILSVSSDIGKDLGKRFLRDGINLIGTYRKFGQMDDLDKNAKCRLLKCDISQKKSVNNFLQQFKKLNLKWDILLSCVGDLLPLNSFFECNFESWNASMQVNSIDQLRVVHGLYPFRNTEGAKVVFFAGGGVNNTVVDASAYTAAKIMLIKMCEFLDTENKDVSFFSIGPGFLKTKIHKQVYQGKNVSRKKIIETENYLKTKKGIKMAYLYESLKWLCQQPKEAVGGRNFSLKGDPFKGKKRNLLVQELVKDQNMYKLRRYKNDFLV
ncbi:hypothetical protein A3D03_06270 [Candidatus Gottesmanbacteria bacterium RIFCSPHIGHO2_02_FULL_40_13]|uniref:Short-chain dehydrogenase n=1 Tax=Candidatus Gottesmanbacteria bacterium RIFCSPHIGHO2_02_FULL_40_13 TaxID=1798384 RepID=A0A1F6A5V0_9BACT|nr:MAG: hypothetical protein A3D03_06270 [Candidatus Gottesmanbacteria bacterium RIFCSPHIGHO2_02_FULL_40_13]